MLKYSGGTKFLRLVIRSRFSALVANWVLCAFIISKLTPFDAMLTIDGVYPLSSSKALSFPDPENVFVKNTEFSRIV